MPPLHLLFGVDADLAFEVVSQLPLRPVNPPPPVLGILLVADLKDIQVYGIFHMPYVTLTSLLFVPGVLIALYGHLLVEKGSTLSIC